MPRGCPEVGSMILAETPLRGPSVLVYTAEGYVRLHANLIKAPAEPAGKG